MGASYRVARMLAITADLGYQITQSFGAMGTVGPGDPVYYSESFAGISLGIMVPVL